jgi:hypothetical protein
MGNAATKPAVAGWRFESHVAPTMTATEMRTLTTNRIIAHPYRSPQGEKSLAVSACDSKDV